MLANSMLPVLLAYQFVIAAAVLIPWMVTGWPLLWLGAKHLGSLPNVRLGKCVLTMVLAGLSSLASSLIPLLGLPAALLLSYLIIKWRLKTTSRKAFLAWLSTWGTVVVILPLMFTIYLPWIEDNITGNPCRMRLKSVGMSYSIYVMEHRGQIPQSLEAIVITKDYPAPEWMQCPSSLNRRQTYFYLPPSPGADPNSIIVCDYRENHRGGRNVLLLNGTSLWMRTSRFTKAMAEPRNHCFATALDEAERRLDVVTPTTNAADAIPAR